MTSIAFAMCGGIPEVWPQPTPVLTRVHFATNYVYIHVMPNPFAWQTHFAKSEEEIER